jgi:N6-adenosine-specific RNA methylase IME4
VTLDTKFRVVCADPPWRFQSNSADKPGRNAARHYPCMSVDAIASIPVGSWIAPDAALFLWITSPMLTIGAHLSIMRAWGFQPSGMGFVWIKTNRDGSLFTGTGFTTRKNAEFCLLGRRGRSVRRDASVHEVIVAPRREHSRKPEEFYARVERYAAGPHLEMFARQVRPGWSYHGNEILFT